MIHCSLFVLTIMTFDVFSVCNCLLVYVYEPNALFVMLFIFPWLCRLYDVISFGCVFVYVWACIDNTLFFQAFSMVFACEFDLECDVMDVDGG